MNIKEDVYQIKKDNSKMMEDILIIKEDVQYIKKMMEDFILSLSPKNDKQEAIKKMIGKLGTIITNDSNMKKNPDISNTINDLFKVII